MKRVLFKKQLFTILTSCFGKFTTKRFTWLPLPHGVFSLLVPVTQQAHILLSHVRKEDLITSQCILFPWSYAECTGKLVPLFNRVFCYLERLVASRLGKHVTRQNPPPPPSLHSARLRKQCWGTLLSFSSSAFFRASSSSLLASSISRAFASTACRCSSSCRSLSSSSSFLCLASSSACSKRQWICQSC